MRNIDVDSEENRKAARENEAYVKALQAPKCSECGDICESGKTLCERCENACPMCGGEVDDDTGICPNCREAVR